MQPREIKGALIARFGSIKAAAEHFNVRVEILSQCWRGARPIYHLRKKIAVAIGKPEHKIFGPRSTRVKSRKAA